MRAKPKDAQTIRRLAADAGIADAELFNLLVTAGGGTPISDEARAEQSLERALELLPLTLVRVVCDTLRMRGTARAAANAGAPDEPAGRASVNGAAATPGTVADQPPTP